MNKRPHFFQFSSRLGLRFAPIGSATLNLGVEHGPPAVLSSAFLQHFPKSKVSSFNFSLPEKVLADDYYSLLAQEFEQAITLINQELKPNETQVAVGGDHSIAFASVAAVLGRTSPESVGLLLFDSHGDLNTVEASLSGNFHGMWLRAVVDEFGQPNLNKLVPDKLPPQNLGLVGNMLLDPAEIDFIQSQSIKHFSQPDKLRSWIKQFQHLHLSFDIDIFKQNMAPATGTPNPNGYGYDYVFGLLAACRDVPSFSLDLVEVNPQKTGATQTIVLAQEVLRYLLSPSPTNAS